MRIGTPIGLILAAGLSVSLWGCGTGANSSGSQGGSGAGSVGGNTGAGGSIGTGATGGDISIGGGNNGGTSQGGSGGSCAGSTVKGELAPLDMYIMLDRSGSMADLTGAQGNGPAKWDAVATALKSFFSDQGSNGLGVGLQFFPLTAAGVPDTCTSSAQCNGHGPCFLKACELELQFAQLVPCDTNNDCGGFGDQCIPLGQCANDTQYVCAYQAGAPQSCGMDANGNDLGNCQQMVSSFCVNADSCTTGDYATPAVEIATLGGAAPALKSAIDQNSPGGSTPTYPALDGAVKHAKDWAAAHPDHKVVAVMATDGLPTECDPTDIASIAQLAANGKNGNPSVLTFVIGVFGANDAGAQQNLNQIAQAGGTTSAFFIQDNQDVTTAFLDALHKIQGQTLQCEYLIPTPPDGSDLDYTKVNVEYTPAGSNTPQTVFYVGKAASCDAVNGGWYYDKDPAQGQVPSKIEMCPATCSKLKGVGGQIDIKIGCQTIVPEAK